MICILKINEFMFMSIGNRAIHFGRSPSLEQCNNVQLTCDQCEPFQSSSFTAKSDATFVAVIGPSANPRGYTAITGMRVLEPRAYRAA